jgi:uncharacterized protein (DUF1330 family)
MTSIEEKGKMKKVVFVILIEEIRDAEMVDSYVKQVAAVFRTYFGQYIARSDKIVPFAGKEPEKAIVIAFDSMEKARKCFSSDEYGKIRHLLQNGSNSRAFFVEND